MIRVKLQDEPRHIIHEFDNENELEKFLKDSGLAIHMLAWMDWGEGRIAPFGLC